MTMVGVPLLIYLINKVQVINGFREQWHLLQSFGPFAVNVPQSQFRVARHLIKTFYCAVTLYFTHFGAR